MPVSCHVVDLVTAGVVAVREAVVDGAGQEVRWVTVMVLDGKEFD